MRVLEDGDIRGYQDPSRLRVRPGRRGTLEDEQHDSVHDQDAEDDGTAFTLFNEERSRRDGTGETRRTLSWIWLNQTTGSDDAADDILRAEWAKSRARAARAKEEVLLLQEEMRRVLSFLEWKSRWWRSQAALRNVDSSLCEGLKAYAYVQADLQDLLATNFRTTWKTPLEDKNLASGDENDEGESDDNEGNSNDDEAAQFNDSDSEEGSEL